MFTTLTSTLKVVAGLLLVAVMMGVIAAIGAVSMAVTPAILVAALVYLGVLSVGTAKAIIVWFALLGGIIGLLKGLLFGVMLDE